ncbi:MAG: histidine ammonia-lyase [Ignavibacteriota bacterium]
MHLLDGNTLTISDVAKAARKEISDFSVSPDALRAVEASRNLVEDWVAKGETIYGITTGFGEFANVSIPHSDIKALQQNLLRSHSAGVGIPLRDEVVRAMLLLRANALAKGYSGVRPLVIEQLLQFLKLDILPVIPSRGSVGSSGDLAPLAHLALALTGEGSISIPRSNGGREILDAGQALKKFKVSPLRLEAKEGLALINGTQMMSAIGSLTIDMAKRLAEIADISAAMSFEALRATDKAFDPRLSDARPHPGQREVAEHMLALTHNSEIRNSHLEGDTRVQDAYSLRCIPQVHGAVRDTIRFAEQVVTTEINSATDNPLIIPNADGTGAHLEGGNFHGEPLALVLDYLAIALSELASISERRTERLVNGALSFGLPRFLTPKGGLHSGFMIAQYTAASLVSENKVLSHPASVDSIPTSANQEDHNSMGSVAALKLEQVVGNVETVIAIEMLCAAQGIDFLKPLLPGEGSGAAQRLIRSVVPFLEDDRNISLDIAKVKELISGVSFVESVRQSIV